MARDRESLLNAQVCKNDEFYTLYEDIEKEMNAYLEFNPDVFKDKTVLLPCDDPDWSNFTKYFAQNFERLGLKKLISTNYAQDSKLFKEPSQLSLFELNSHDYDESKINVKGKIFILTKNNKKVDIHDLKWKYMESDGDFRSEEVTKLRDEADFIITNPPFSLFREFLAWIMEANKRFVILGNVNIITYKEVFPLLKDNKVWMGFSFNKTMEFIMSDSYELKGKAYIDKDGKKHGFVPGICWLTNIDHRKHHEKISLMTMSDNLKYSKHKIIKELGYPQYANYDAIEVAFADAIPSDYDGVCGVPITWLGKYNPEIHEIIGLGNGREHFTPSMDFENPIRHSKNGKVSRAGMLNRVLAYKVKEKPKKGTYYTADNVDGFLIAPYARILIKRKKEVESGAKMKGEGE